MFDAYKDFNNLHMDKIRGFLDEYTDPEYFYFFSYGDKFAFIKRCRKNYQILVSCQCGFNLAIHKGNFSVFGEYDSLQDSISAFHKVIGFILKPKTFFIDKFVSESSELELF